MESAFLSLFLPDMCKNTAVSNTSVYFNSKVNSDSLPQPYVFSFFEVVKCPSIKFFSVAGGWGGCSCSSPRQLFNINKLSDQNSCSSHNSSSWSRSAGFRSPPTLIRRSRSASSAAFCASSRSSEKSSELSPENSLSWMRKSRRSSLNFGRSVL